MCLFSLICRLYSHIFSLFCLLGSQQRFASASKDHIYFASKAPVPPLRYGPLCKAVILWGIVLEFPKDFKLTWHPLSFSFHLIFVKWNNMQIFYHFPSQDKDAPCKESLRERNSSPSTRKDEKCYLLVFLFSPWTFNQDWI